MFKLFFTFAALVLVGCSSSADRELREEAQLRQRYPAGATRAEIIKAHGEPIQSGNLTESEKQNFKNHFAADAASYDVFSIWGGGSLGPGGVSIYDDHVYYDAQQRCIWASRRKVD